MRLPLLSTISFRNPCPASHVCGASLIAILPFFRYIKETTTGGILIQFNQRITQPSLRQLISELDRQPPDTAVYIQSGGGEVPALRGALHVLEERQLTIHVGGACSLAVTLAVTGVHRIGYPGTRFGFHQVSLKQRRDGNVVRVATLEMVRQRTRSGYSPSARQKAERWLHRLEQTQNWYIRYLYERTKLDRSTLLMLMIKERVLGVAEAHHYGLVDDIIDL